MARGKTAEWKERFTDRQLERKRLVDRVGQRRTRDQLKKTVADLTERVELLSQAHGSVIVERLLAENDQLRVRLNECKSKITAIRQLSNDYLDNTGDPQLLPASPARSSQEDLAVVKATKALEVSLSSIAKDLPFFSAILFCRTSRSEASSPASTIFSENELLDLIMSWKLSASHTLGFEFLLGSLGLDREPMLLTPKHVLDRVRRKDFYSAIVQGLSAVEDIVSPFANPDGVEQESIPEIECQRRAVILCAYEITSRWRKLFASRFEHHAQFWGLYRLFMLLSFPGEDNLNRTPKWMRPSRAQLTYPHPGFIDCILWPRIRDYLLHAWHRHNAQALCVTFVHCLELNVPNKQSIASTLVVAPNNCGIELDPLFATAISTIKNFRLKDDFARLFPELASALDEASASDDSVESAGHDAMEAAGPSPRVGNSNVGTSEQPPPNYQDNSHDLPPFAGFDLDGPLSIFGPGDFNLFPLPIHGSIFSAGNLAEPLTL